MQYLRQVSQIQILSLVHTNCNNRDSTNTITFNVGSGGGGGTGAVVEATVGVGGTLSFTITNPGTGYVNPQINIPEPVYENLEVVGISRLGVGATTDTGCKFTLNVGVSAAINKCWNWFYNIPNKRF